MFWEVIPIALLTAVCSTAATLWFNERRLRRDHRLDFAAERVARELMMHEQFKLRSFDRIQSHLGGFDDDALRQVLVKAGGVRFHSSKGVELWGLVERNRDMLGRDAGSVEP